MAARFFDSSALVKRWIAERGSGWMRAQTGPGPGEPCFVTRFVGVEVAGALTRARRGGRLSPTAHATALAELQRDLLQRFDVVEVTRTTLDRALALAAGQGLRGADALHLAAACEVHEAHLAAGWGRLTLVSADAELLAASPRFGLLVENPLDHATPGE